MYRCFTCFRVFMVPIVISETLRNVLAEGNLFDGGLKFHMIKKTNIKLQTIQMYITVLSLYVYNEPLFFFFLFRLQVSLLRIWTTVPQMSFSILWTSMSEYLQMRKQNMQSYHWVLWINIVRGYLKNIYDICHRNSEVIWIL